MPSNVGGLFVNQSRFSFEAHPPVRWEELTSLAGLGLGLGLDAPTWWFSTFGFPSRPTNKGYGEKRQTHILFRHQLLGVNVYVVRLMG